jgi:wyosine [tRNA(Phe)-imidazoG37] synthetase (radical SAM superfamily)
MVPRLRDITSGALSLLGIITSKHVFAGPRSIALAISDVCNTNCVMCWPHSPLIRSSEKLQASEQLYSNPRSSMYMDPKLLETILRECRQMGTFRAVLGGHGDPSLHPQFDSMLDLMMQLEMEPYVLTNGLSLTERRARLWSSMQAHFRFSIHAGDRETWVSVHPSGTPKQFDRLSNMIKLLVASGKPHVSNMHVISKANFRNIRAMVEHAHQIGVKEVLFRPVRVQGALSEVVLSVEEEVELHKELRDCLKLAENYGIRSNLKEYLENNLYIQSGVMQTYHLYCKIPCYIGWIYAEFDIDGTMTPCLYSTRVMGRAGEQKIGEMWHSSDYWAFRREARKMPQSGKPVKGCSCNACCMAKYNVNIHNLLRFRKFNYGGA